MSCEGGEGRGERRKGECWRIHVYELLGDNEAVVTNEGAAGGTHALLAVGGEGDVGGTGVAAVEGPLGLAMAEDEAAWVGSHGGRFHCGRDMWDERGKCEVSR
jgi:hypothetical protein